MKKDAEGSKPYRPCVVGVFTNEKKELLVALRSDTQTWQFPQGGVEKGESLQEALYREMMEELGSNEFDILAQADSSLRYNFPKDFKGPLAQSFRGQEQYWFLCQFKSGFGPDLKQSTCDEFLETQWVSAREIVDTIVEWKRETYIEGLHLLGVQ